MNVEIKEIILVISGMFGSALMALLNPSLNRIAINHIDKKLNKVFLVNLGLNCFILLIILIPVFLG